MKNVILRAAGRRKEKGRGKAATKGVSENVFYMSVSRRLLSGKVV